MPMIDAQTLKKLNRLKTIARFMDSGWGIPFTKVRFGADAVVGLVPGVGDVGAALVSLYIVLEAKKLGAPNALLVRMLANVAIDTGLGAMPVVGDVFDVLFKSNLKNIDLLDDFIYKEASNSF
ncbi:MAG: DUF4112 domain-containing protein [Alphaproteobacteria bacterium]|nr:DUF4112 domain-containing protein [Alphaproteobacteria bacterium]